MAVFSNAEVIARLQTIPTGTKIALKYHHVRDSDNIIKFQGTLLKKGNGWIIKRNEYSYRGSLRTTRSSTTSWS